MQDPLLSPPVCKVTIKDPTVHDFLDTFPDIQETFTDIPETFPDVLDTFPSVGPSGVRALSVAAGTNEGGHYFLYFSTSSYQHTNPIISYPPTFYPRRDCRRILIFCMGSILTKI